MLSQKNAKTNHKLKSNTSTKKEAWNDLFGSTKYFKGKQGFMAVLVFRQILKTSFTLFNAD